MPKMKRYQIAIVFAAGLMAVGLVSCKEKKVQTDIITTKPVIEKAKPTQVMGDYEQTIPVDWVGSTYQVVTRREADKSLPVIDEGQGEKYYDNRISVRIVRKDGSEFFSRTFTKDDFASCVSASYRSNTALLGIVFDKAEADHLVFAASVGSPDQSSDDYVPLLLRISRYGDVSMSKDTQLDTGAVGEGDTAVELDDDEDGV